MLERKGTARISNMLLSAKVTRRIVLVGSKGVAIQTESTVE